MSEYGSDDGAGPVGPDPDVPAGPDVPDVPPAEADGATVDAPAGSSPVSEWAVPGVPRTQPVLVPSAQVAAVRAALEALASQDVAVLSDGQARADLEALLDASAVLARLRLARLADAQDRQLHRLAGFRSATGWLAEHGDGASSTELTVARTLTVFPAVHAALLDGRVTVAAGQKLHSVLGKLRPHLDRTDGLLDGADAEAAVTNVITDGVRMAVAQARGGFPTLTDPVLKTLTTQLERIAALPIPQLGRLEQALVLLATHVEPGQLSGALTLLVDALLPSRLADTAHDGHDRRFLSLTPTPDGGAFDLRGRLDLLCGERLRLVLDAALRTDPDNVLDTETAARLREQGIDPHDSDLAPTLTPRNRGQRRHDALDQALTSYLAAELAGSHDANPVQIGVTLTQPTLDAEPGAPPAVTTTGTLLPASIWQALACGSAFTRLVLDLRGKVIETSHTSRTLKPHERRALHTQTGGHCQGAGCTRSTRQPGTILHPHHTDPWARCGTTSLADTADLCDCCHAYLHRGHPLRLKDGRLLGPHGWITE